MLEEKWISQTNSVRNDKPLTCISAYYSLLFLFLSDFSSNKTVYHIQHLPPLQVEVTWQKQEHHWPGSPSFIPTAAVSSPSAYILSSANSCSLTWLSRDSSPPLAFTTHSAVFWYCWGTNRPSFSQPYLVQCHQEPQSNELHFLNLSIRKWTLSQANPGQH